MRRIIAAVIAATCLALTAVPANASSRIEEERHMDYSLSVPGTHSNWFTDNNTSATAQTRVSVYCNGPIAANTVTVELYRLDGIFEKLITHQVVNCGSYRDFGIYRTKGDKFRLLFTKVNGQKKPGYSINITGTVWW